VGCIGYRGRTGCEGNAGPVRYNPDNPCRPHLPLHSAHSEKLPSAETTAKILIIEIIRNCFSQNSQHNPAHPIFLNRWYTSYSLDNRCKPPISHKHNWTPCVFNHRDPDNRATMRHYCATGSTRNVRAGNRGTRRRIAARACSRLSYVACVAGCRVAGSSVHSFVIRHFRAVCIISPFCLKSITPPALVNS